MIRRCFFLVMMILFFCSAQGKDFNSSSRWKDADEKDCSSSITSNEFEFHSGNRLLDITYEQSDATGDRSVTASFVFYGYEENSKCVLFDIKTDFLPSMPLPPDIIPLDRESYEQYDDSYEAPQYEAPRHEAPQKETLQQETPQHEMQSQSSPHAFYGSERSSCIEDSVKELAHDRMLQEYADRQYPNNYDKDIKNYLADNPYSKKRSVVYLWCKRVKKSAVGPNQKEKEEEAKNYHELEQAYFDYHLDCKSSSNKYFLDVMEQRKLPFEKSLKQKSPAVQQFKLQNSTIGFMQAHNINYHHFLQLNGFTIQHQLTQELICNLNELADIASQNFNNQDLLPIVQSGALVSGLAQDYNQQNKLSDAMSSTNCSYGLLLYLQAMTLQQSSRCETLLTALSFFNTEFIKYSKAVICGVGKAVAHSEIAALAMTGVGIMAPRLTQLVYTGATKIITPIVFVAGAICGVALCYELGKLGYLYSQDDKKSLQAELESIKNLAGQFYNFDQAPQAHVENIANLATTFIWPWQREQIFNSLMGMQNVICRVYTPENIVEYKRVVNSYQLESAFKYIKRDELAQFVIEYEKTVESHVFSFYPRPTPETVIKQLEEAFIPTQAKVASQLLLKKKETIVGVVAESVASKMVIMTEKTRAFLATPVGAKMFAAIRKKYEGKFFVNAADEYAILLANNAPQKVLDIFFRCHELSIVPQAHFDAIQLNHLFEKSYPGVSLQVRHIFYPSLKATFSKDCQAIKDVILNGFHHDENGVLEKAGLFTYTSKVYGQAAHGAEECIAACLDFGDGIFIDKIKTFFPPSWPRKKVAEVVFEAYKKILKEIPTKDQSKRMFQCQGPNNMLIDIVVDLENVITSAYPSKLNFIG
ncbi:hypothetical protein KBC04_00215 [Candidatus Babeliales bacterium]|nr:hypothetical protein [Candidatus Babeliales bacterium]MBP9843485.1 hypothetical protein [Candidatus Babeliales bacterium]